MFWNARGFGCVTVLIKLGQIKYGWNVAGSNKKVIEMGKKHKKKHTFFIQSFFCPLFWWKGKFLDITSAELSSLRLIWYRCCKEFQILSQCWTTLPIRQISNKLDLQHVHMFIFNPLIHMANTKMGSEFEHVIMLKIQNVWNLSDTFAFILPQQRPVLVSAHAQNFFSWCSAKKTLQGNTNCTAPNTVTGVSKVENETHLPYLQLCRKALLII